MITEGHRLLRKYLETTTQVSLSKKIGIAQQSISKWAQGFGRPSLDTRALLELAANIPADAWRTAKERELFARAAKTARTGTDG